MTTTEPLEIKVEPKDLDEDKFVSIWNIASATMEGDDAQTRLLAGKLIGFLCKYKCEFISVSPADAKYLDEFYEKDNALLNDWKEASDKVDVITQHAYVQHDALMRLLTKKKFSIEKKYAPTRANRREWFENDWNVG